MRTVNKNMIHSVGVQQNGETIGYGNISAVFL